MINNFFEVKKWFDNLTGNNDPVDENDIFSKVKIYRTPSTKIFEILIGVIVVCIFLLNIRDFILDTSNDRLGHLALGGVGIFAPLASLWHSYHPKITDLPINVVNAQQVRYISLCDRFASLGLALFFLWGSCNSLIENETIFFDGMVVCGVLLALNVIYFMYKIYKIRKCVEVKPEPIVKNEKILCIGILVAIFLIDFLLHILLEDVPGGGIKGFLIGVVSVFIVIGITWFCQRYLGLFKEITPEEKEEMNKKNKK